MIWINAMKVAIVKTKGQQNLLSKSVFYLRKFLRAKFMFMF